jgi:ABC-2 type transport system ATP-binding protein
MIEVQCLTRRFGETTAVEDVSFRIGSHGIVGLLGHNGAGKTTIMRMLCGYLEPSAGSIALDGTPMADNPRHLQESLGYLPENLPVYPDMLVADYLEYAATLKGIGRRERLAAVREALSSTDLLSRALEPIGILSRGFKQRVGVAQAILGRPRLLVLDEPTNGLDPNQTGHMRELIKGLAQRSTIILSTHIMQEVNAVCDRVLILRNGKLAMDCSLSELQDSKTLLLRVGNCPQSLLAELQSLQPVVSVEQVSVDGERLELAIRLRSDSDEDAAADEVSRQVINGGAKLYQAEVPGRDLERIFREVSERGD